jgi:DNA-binding MarR family transcriptional regulator
MSSSQAPSLEETLYVRDHCLCFHAQRAARAVARRFDDAFRPFDLTNGQFSLMMSLNRPEPPTLGSLAPFLSMDRTTLTAALKPLVRRGLVRVTVDQKDRRSRRLTLTRKGKALLATVLPVWRKVQTDLDARLDNADRLCRELLELG